MKNWWNYVATKLWMYIMLCKTNQIQDNFNILLNIGMDFC